MAGFTSCAACRSECAQSPSHCTTTGLMWPTVMHSGRLVCVHTMHACTHMYARTHGLLMQACMHTHLARVFRLREERLWAGDDIQRYGRNGIPSQCTRNKHARTRTHAHTRTHTHERARAHTHTATHGRNCGFCKKVMDHYVSLGRLGEIAVACVLEPVEG